jgi:hypothetical protein
MHQKTCICRALGAHACNPSYLGGRDHEDQDLKPAPGKYFVRLYQKKKKKKKTKTPNTKNGWWGGSSD